MEGRARRSSTVRQDKCFQILKMMTEKLHVSLNAVSNNVFKICALLAVPPIHLETVQRTPTPVTRQSVSHEILDLFQWSTTIEQELAHVITALSAARQTNGTWPLERKLSKHPATDVSECNKRNPVPAAVRVAWLDDILVNLAPIERSPSSSPRNHYNHQPHHHSSHHHSTHHHPHYHPHHPLYQVPQHQYHFPRHPHSHHNPHNSTTLDNMNTASDTSSSNSPTSTNSSSTSNDTPTPPKPQRAESSPPKRLTERLTDKLSFRRKRSIPPIDISSLSTPSQLPIPELDIDASPPPSPFYGESDNECITATSSPSHNPTSDRSDCDDVSPCTPPTTPATTPHGFTSDDEAPVPPFSPSTRRKSAPLCFTAPATLPHTPHQDAAKEKEKDREKDKEKEKDKDKTKSPTWRLWSKSTGNSTDEEIAVNTRRRGLPKKTKFRLRLFESKDCEVGPSSP